MSHYFYITPEEYAKAAELGISATMLDRRVRQQLWSKQKAMTTPPRVHKPRGHYSEWAETAKRNGICYKTFMVRIRNGYSAEKAATQPLQTIEDLKQNALRATEFIRVYPESALRLAEQNGIPYHTFHRRVKKSKWPIERAATEPLWTRQQMGRFGAQRLRDREGDWAAQIFGKRRG
ncbi:hypothetical protein PaecuDRAFT_3103 [Paenibacillus curdlanolyticus YK9]|uniref:Uncharacterized protein n=1 Tax=Paenibacillus curdlanolyticus YK9 TaxID=717606 RepID=E0IBR4_9BACL|nr:hypothetical protein [Paenibacillus curdlanolyticus]EFM10144.1 hypothetical protein PaecuDRAFT_3103 [Paenibacillus curdlanolyticus YK9]